VFRIRLVETAGDEAIETRFVRAHRGDRDCRDDSASSAVTADMVT
jgi:hypothetical protein